MKDLSPIKLSLPPSKDELKKLNIGNILYITGKVVAMRDLAHKRYIEWKKQGKYIPFEFEGNTVYHCGPLVKREEKEWKVISAGPTTSKRMESVLPEFVRLSKVKIIIGKGGIKEEIIEILRKEGCIYCDFIGGAGVIAAKSVEKVISVHWLDLGLPEAVWVFEVKEFGPLIVSYDLEGRSLR